MKKNIKLHNPELSIIGSSDYLHFATSIIPEKLSFSVPDNAVPLRIAINNEYIDGIDISVVYLYKQNFIIKPKDRMVYLVKPYTEFNAKQLYYLNSINIYGTTVDCFVDREFAMASFKDSYEQ